MLSLALPLSIPDRYWDEDGRLVSLCPCCGREYEPTRHWQKYCSTICKTRSNYELNREYRIAFQQFYRSQMRITRKTTVKSRYADFDRRELERLVEKRDAELAAMQEAVDVRDRQINDLIGAVQDLKKTVEGMNQALDEMRRGEQTTRPYTVVEVEPDPIPIVVTNAGTPGSATKNLIKSMNAFGIKKG